MLNISKHFLGRNGVELGWGCKNSGLRTNCFVIDSIETQLIRHMGLFHAIKENRTKLKWFCNIVFLITLLHFAQYLPKIAGKVARKNRKSCKKLKYKIFRNSSKH